MANGDKRSSRRAAVVLRIKLRYTDVDQLIDKFAINISRTGIFVRSKKPKDPGTVVAFELRLADGETVVKGRGEVRWTRPFDPGSPRQPYGMGIAFTDVDDESRAVIERMVEHKIARGGQEVEGQIPHQLSDPEPQREVEQAPAPPREPPVAVPEPAPRPPSASAPLPPERPRPPRSTVKQVLEEAESGPIDWPPGRENESLLETEVSVDDVMARARQLTRGDHNDLLRDLESSDGEGEVPSVEQARAEFAALFGRSRPRGNGARDEAEPQPQPLVDPGTKLGMGEERRLSPAPAAPAPLAPVEESAPLDEPGLPLIDSDHEIDSALEALAPMEPDPAPAEPERLRPVEPELDPDPVAASAQRAIDAAEAAVDDVAARVHERLDEDSESDPTFISDLPSAALASDLASDSENQLGSLGSLMEPEEQLAPRLVHGVEDFLGESPGHTSPIGIDVDQTLARLEDAQPAGIAEAGVPSPEDSLDLDVDLSEFEEPTQIQTAPPPLSPIGHPPPAAGPSLPGVPDPGAEPAGAPRFEPPAPEPLAPPPSGHPPGRETPELSDLPGARPFPERETPDLADLPGAVPPPIPQPDPLEPPPPQPMMPEPLELEDPDEGEDGKKKKGFFKRIFRKE